MNADIQKINAQLLAFPQQIYDATQKTEDLREAWLLLDATKDFESAIAFLLAKASTEKITESQAKAKATEAIYDRTMEVIRAESSYRRALADQVRLDNEFVAIRKIAGIEEAMISSRVTA
jgi:hypothetical protein